MTGLHLHPDVRRMCEGMDMYVCCECAACWVIPEGEAVVIDGVDYGSSPVTPFDCPACGSRETVDFIP